MGDDEKSNTFKELEKKAQEAKIRSENRQMLAMKAKVDWFDNKLKGDFSNIPNHSSKELADDYMDRVHQLAKEQDNFNIDEGKFSKELIHHVLGELYHIDKDPLRRNLLNKGKDYKISDFNQAVEQKKNQTFNKELQQYVPERTDKSVEDLIEASGMSNYAGPDKEVNKDFFQDQQYQQFATAHLTGELGRFLQTNGSDLDIYKKKEKKKD